MPLELLQKKGHYGILGGTEVGEEVLGMGLDTLTALLQEARESLKQFRSSEGTFWQKSRQLAEFTASS